MKNPTSALVKNREDQKKAVNDTEEQMLDTANSMDDLDNLSDTPVLGN